MKKLRGAIVGFGKVAGEAHLPGFAVRLGYQIDAVVDVSAERLMIAAAALPGIRTFRSLSELLDARLTIDFVDIATPPRDHARLAAEALGAGLHVLCEKPLATRAEELAELAGLAAPRRCALVTVHNWRHAPLFQSLCGLLRSGVVGELREIDWWVRRPNPPMGATEVAPWRIEPELSGGGIVLDHGWHAFYLMLSLTGTMPRSLRATLDFERGLAVEDNAEIVLDFDRAVARVHLSWTADRREIHALLQGSRGQIEVDDGRLIVRPEGREPEERTFAPPISGSSYHPEWFPPLLDEFREEVLNTAIRGTSWTEAERCARMVFAAYRSGGESIPLPTTDASG